MMKSHWGLAAALAMVVPATAHADKQTALADVGIYATAAHGNMERVEKGHLWTGFHELAKNCAKSVVDAKAAGAKPGDLVAVDSANLPGAQTRGGKHFITFAGGEKICNDLGVGIVASMFSTRLGNVFDEIETFKKAEPSAQAADKGSAGTRECERVLQMAREIGVPDDRPFTYLERKTSLTELHTLCSQFEPIGKELQARWDEQEKGRDEAALAPYKKAGVAGDKLAFIQDEMETRLYSKGGKVIETPKQFAKASVVCYVVETPEGNSLIHRYRYKGNKLASSDDATYLTYDKALDNCR